MLDFFTGNDIAWKKEQGIEVSPDEDNSLEVRWVGRIVIVSIGIGMLGVVVTINPRANRESAKPEPTQVQVQPAELDSSRPKETSGKGP